VDSANGWGQEGLRVRVITGRANLVLLGHGLGGDVDTDANETVVLHDSLVVLLLHWQPEASFVLIPLEWSITLLAHVLIVVLLVNAQGSSSQLSIFEWLSKVNHRRSNKVVRLEEVSIEGLNGKLVVLAGDLALVVKTVVETSVTSLAAVMSISLQGVLLAVEKGADIDI